MGILIALIGLIFIYRLLQLQIVQGEEFKEQSEQRLLRSVSVKPPRGEILDRYGRPLVTNRMGFSVQVHKTHISNERFNEVLLKLLDIIEKNETAYVDRLPISQSPPFAFQFSDQGELTKQVQQEKWNTARKIDSYATAEQAIGKLKEQYKISDEYSELEVRKLIGLREDMKERQFGSNMPFTIATDVNQHTVMQLEEGHLDFPGITVNVEPIRHYVNGEFAAHILGRVDIIYAEEYKALKDKGYGMNDILGKDGIEKILEPYLRGKAGKKLIEQNVKGKLTKVLDNTFPVPGNNVILTIDADLQKVAELALRENILRIREEAEKKIEKNPERIHVGEDANSGAVVVMDVNTGEILAMATHPTYDPARFKEDYVKLSKDPLKPMYNRAISGTYSPGSTFKPLTAIAALEEGIITPQTRIRDKGKYMFYADSGHTPRCWIYQAKHGYATHGNINVSQALQHSCNYFFYDIGRRLTINKIEAYAKKFALGELTGIELSGENRGILGGPESRKRLYDKPWYPGETLSAAIGEMHAFTPIQLVSYASTLANRGNRYKAHLIKRVRTYDRGKKVLEVEPEILSEVNIAPAHLDAILKGMQSVTLEDGTASRVFRDFPISVAGKTGTAERAGVSDNGVFMGFAPYDNPQIAVAVVIEQGGSGSNTAPVARDIIAAYFGLDRQQKDAIATNQLVP